MKKVLLVFAIFLGMMQFFYGSWQTDFADGCELYKKLDFEKALEKFKALENDYPTMPVFYNTANTYFRLGKIGWAIVYYERTRKISPFDEDVNFNIKFIADIIKDTDYEKQFISKIKLSFVKLLFSFCFFIFAVAISIKIVKPRKNIFWFLAISSLVFILSLGLFIYRYQNEKETEAIVITNNAEVRSGPDESFKINLTFPEGKKILILGKTDNWLEIGVRILGIKGWIEKKYVEVI
ncbi:MAG: hypothetical protein V1833_02100 [Elusimicrobiota bacterium]